MANGEAGVFRVACRAERLSGHAKGLSNILTLHDLGASVRRATRSRLEIKF